MKIIGVRQIANTDSVIFFKNLSAAINELQDDGQTVEVQYQTAILGDNSFVMSALIIGRKEE